MLGKPISCLMTISPRSSQGGGKFHKDWNFMRHLCAPTDHGKRFSDSTRTALPLALWNLSPWKDCSSRFVLDDMGVVVQLSIRCSQSFKMMLAKNPEIPRVYRNPEMICLSQIRGWLRGAHCLFRFYVPISYAHDIFF